MYWRGTNRHLNRAYSAGLAIQSLPGAMPQAVIEAAPLALTKCERNIYRKRQDEISSTVRCTPIEARKSSATVFVNFPDQKKQTRATAIVTTMQATTS